MKLQTKLIRKVSKNNGSTLMEFAVVTGLMAILAVAGMPKLSTVGENAALQKSKNELEIKDTEINIMMEDIQLTLQSLNYKNKEIKAILPIIINEVDFLARKENKLSFENLLKLAMNYLDKESSNIAS